MDQNRRVEVFNKLIRDQYNYRSAKVSSQSRLKLQLSNPPFPLIYPRISFKVIYINFYILTMSEETKADAPMETKSTTTTSTTVTKKGGSKTMIIVIIALVLLCCCASIIGGAIYFYQRARSLAPADVLNSITNNTTSILNPTNGGTISDNQGNSISVSLPSGFPTDVPIVAGSTVTYGVKNSDGSFAVNVTSTGKTTQQVVDAYKLGLTSNGWTIQSEGSIFGYVLTADKDTREVNLVVLGTTDSNGKDVQSTTISVGPKQ